MVDVCNPKCSECNKTASYNVAGMKKGIYCNEHKLEGMINVRDKKCKETGCNMIPTFNFIIEEIKYCNDHCPDSNLVKKRQCKYCDINEESKYICNDCNQIKNKKEWGIVRYLRKNIDIPFEYNSSKMLQGCSRKRPDVYFELSKHCVIVEIDEYQHNTYEDSCECARLNEIVNGIGGKSVIIIRYNPDKVMNKGIQIEFPQIERLELLIETIKKELNKDYDHFIVKLVQLYYNDDYDKYKIIKKENITSCITI
jgi:hypothetical protein